MTEAMTTDKVVHFEIPFDDSERAFKFYRDIFGWKISKAGDMPYWMADAVEVDDRMVPKTPGAINGGMLHRDKENDPSGSKPLIVIQVSDVEEYCRKIEEAGGRTMTPARKVGDMGIYARVEDTEGNVIGLWKPLIK